MAARSSRSRKKRFEFSALKEKGKLGLKAGDTGNDVRALQTFLGQTGYLGRNRIPALMCKGTCDALRHFQKCYGLPDTGDADADTLHLMQRPRCGVPDIGDNWMRESGPAPFTLVGCRYDTNDVTYAFANGTPDLGGNREHEIVREAFAAWTAVTPLRFAEVPMQASPTFTISWDRGDHGDGFPFDDAGSISGNTLAHAFFPPPCGGANAGALHFDEFEGWADAAAPGRIRLLNVAIHEIGHLLGLRHSNVPNAIMFAFYDDAVDSLRQDDIDGIQALYGTRPAGPAPLRGQLGGDGEAQLHRIPVQPGRLRVTLQGPSGGPDFDLYVRAGLAPTRSLFDARGFSADSTEIVELDVIGGDIFIMVDSWRGGGTYEVTVEQS